MTAALEGGEWSTARPGHTLPPGKTRYPLYRRLGGPQGRSGRAEKLVSTGIRSRTVQPVVSRYTDWAIRLTHTHTHTHTHKHTHTHTHTRHHISKHRSRQQQKFCISSAVGTSKPNKRSIWTLFWEMPVKGTSSVFSVWSYFNSSDRSTFNTTDLITPLISGSVTRHCKY